jgi:hypothetical protein
MRIVALTMQGCSTSNRSTGSLEAHCNVEAKFDQPRERRRQIDNLDRLSGRYCRYFEGYRPGANA